MVLLWLLDPVNDPANLSFRRKEGFLGIGKPVLDKSSRYCHFRSGLEFINIGCEALGGRFCKPQSMIGLVQSKIKIFTFHRFTLVLFHMFVALRELVFCSLTGDEDLRGRILPVRKRLAARIPEGSNQVADSCSSLMQRFDELL